MTTRAFQTLLEAARQTHAETPVLNSFCAFPDDLEEAVWSPHHIKAAELMASESNWPDGALALKDAFVAASKDAQWRETYKNTEIGAKFLDRFACYAMIGPGGPWTSRQMYGFVVYMPAGLWYPWHHHPAEELYFVIAGEGEFLRAGKPSKTLRPGEASFHASNEPHALQTHDNPVMAYVLWRNGFETLPVLTPPEQLEKSLGDEQRA